MSLAAADAGFRVDERWLVRAVTLAFEPGQLVALVGPNGSGKTTLLRLLSGVWEPSEGRVTLEGRSLRAIPRRMAARRVALVPQDTHIAFAFTVREVVAMGRHAHRGRFERERPEDRRAVEDAMSRADVSSLANRLVTELSGGERQRVLIARCLATEADHVLLDEPTANLDIAHALEVLTFCRALAAEGRTIVIALHDLNAALRFATRAVLLSRGRIEAQGEAATVLTPEAISRVFGVQVAFVQHSAGQALVFDRRPGPRRA
jgi:iron complex transport system ATP-binding protein